MQVIMPSERSSCREREKYLSKLHLPAEARYNTAERELLGVVWAVKNFRGYIEGSEVTLDMDHQPLKWVLTLKTLTGRLA